MPENTTIFALASAPGRGGVAVFRVSGPQAGKVVEVLTKESIPSERVATLRTFHDETGPLDKGLVLYFQGPNSFTGEDVAELHTHGGRAITSAILGVVGTLPGCRMAEPGEFSRRAFENGKLDLTQAEAIADLVDAETEAQRAQAFRQLEGELGTLYHGWAETLKKTLAHLEAYLDFPDEPIPPEVATAHQKTIADMIAGIDTHMADGHRGERLRDGIRIAIVGAPNAGKSSLLNALAMRNAAIVSPTPGTTRDVVEVPLNMGGFPIVLQDTAGLRDTSDAIEAEGVRRASARAAEADIVLAVFDAGAAPDAETLALVTDKTIVITNKTDTNRNVVENSIAVSAETGAGLDMLKDAILQRLQKDFAGGTAPSLTRVRHRAALQETRTALARTSSAPTPELAAEDLRMALRHIGAITGRVDVEQLLDVIFRDFCIGK